MDPGRRRDDAVHWSIKYVGKPYAEADCAELAVEVQHVEFGRCIGLPCERFGGPFALSDQISRHQGDYAERTESPQDGDAVLMRARGRLNHIGIYCDIGGQPWVLHAMRNAGQTCLHPLADLEKLNLQVEGFYRWL
jgi:hypothetical protein